jgi:hypothetical protein
MIWANYRHTPAKAIGDFIVRGESPSLGGTASAPQAARAASLTTAATPPFLNPSLEVETRSGEGEGLAANPILAR